MLESGDWACIMLRVIKEDTYGMLFNPFGTHHFVYLHVAQAEGNMAYQLPQLPQASDAQRLYLQEARMQVNDVRSQIRS